MMNKWERESQEEESQRNSLKKEEKSSLNQADNYDTINLSSCSLY